MNIHNGSKGPGLTILACLMVCGLLLLGGCGKKEWPAPFAPEDQFEWKEIAVERQGLCVVLKTVVSGAYYNLREVSVEWTEIGPEGDCPACPFTPRFRADLSASSGQIVREGPRIAVRVCQIPQGKQYRFRLIGHNVYEQLGHVVSDVVDLH